MSLAGKVAVVTGSTSGIGFAIAKKLCMDGAKVVLSSRKSANVDMAVENLEKEGLKHVAGTVCHVGKADDRSALTEFAVEKFGRIDILVNNAGISPVYGPMLELKGYCFRYSDERTGVGQGVQMFNTNVKAGFLLAQKVVPIMEKIGGGSIVFVSSITGYTPFQGIGAYGVTKTALLGLVKALCMECGQKNIRVNGIAPGIIQTAFSKQMWEDADARKFYESTTPLGRWL